VVEVRARDEERKRRRRVNREGALTLFGVVCGVHTATI